MSCFKNATKKAKGSAPKGNFKKAAAKAKAKCGGKKC